MDAWRGVPEELAAVGRAALRAADPGLAVDRSWPADLDRAAAVRVIAVGKGSVAMARAAAVRLGLIGDSGSSGGSSRLAGGLVVTLDEHAADAESLRPLGFEVVVSDHPTPSERSVRAGERVAAWARSVRAGEVVLGLVSGGGSAQIAAPVDGVSLADVASVSGDIMRAGATIDELNTVRMGMDRLKGGGVWREVVRACASAGGVVLVLSDVLGDDPGVVSSGPFVWRGVDRVAGSGDAGRSDRALGVLARLGLADRYPTVVRAIRRAWRGESGPTHPIEHRLIGSNATAVEAAAERLRAMGHRRVETRLGVIGEACEVGRALGQRVQQMAAARGHGDHDGPSAVVWGGETTVTVGEAHGRGGPCQEAALAAAVALDGVPGRVLALATDGRDGPTDAAGAWADGSTVSAACRLGVDLSRALETHDSLSACGRLGVLIETGRTGTNVNDVLVGVVSPGG